MFFAGMIEAKRLRMNAFTGSEPLNEVTLPPAPSVVEGAHTCGKSCSPR